MVAPAIERTAAAWSAATAKAGLERAAAWFAESERIWIGTHLDPDGDAIGSLLGLGRMLASSGKAVTLACQDAPPREASWLPGAIAIKAQAPSDEDLLVALDAAEPERLGSIHVPEIWRARRSIVIDHHVSNPGFGQLNAIDPEASSTAELILDLSGALGLEPDAAAATCLLTGLVTDTIGFRTANTSARSLRCAAHLVAAGASLPEVSQQVFYRQPLAALQLVGLAVGRLSQHGPFAWTWLEQADLRRLGAHAEDTREITRLVASAEEPRAVAVLRERSDGDFDLSLRSKPGVDLVPAARALGGGGHPQACGARLAGPLESARDRVLAALERHVENLDGPREEPDHAR